MFKSSIVENSITERCIWMQPEIRYTSEQCKYSIFLMDILCVVVTTSCSFSNVVVQVRSVRVDAIPFAVSAPFMGMPPFSIAQWVAWFPLHQYSQVRSWPSSVGSLTWGRSLKNVFRSRMWSQTCVALLCNGIECCVHVQEPFLHRKKFACSLQETTLDLPNGPLKCPVSNHPKKMPPSWALQLTPRRHTCVPVWHLAFPEL